MPTHTRRPGRQDGRAKSLLPLASSSIWLRPPQPLEWALTARDSEGQEVRLLGVRVAACSGRLALHPVQLLLQRRLRSAERPPRRQGEISQTHQAPDHPLPVPLPED